MKRYIAAAIVTTGVLSAVGFVSGQTTEPSIAATQSAEIVEEASPSSEIQDLKDKIATKVAELRKKNQKAVAGTIIKIAAKTITIKTADEAEYDIKVDDTLTKYYLVGTTKKEIKFSDLKKDAYIIVTGPVLDKTVDANYIYQDEQYLVKSGKIIEVNKDDFFIKVTTSTKDTYTLDVENQTAQQMMNIKTFELEKIGFSKMKEGDTVHFVAKKTGTEKEANRFAATKILIVPQEYFQK